MKKLVLFISLLPALTYADAARVDVTNLSLSLQTKTMESWIQMAMRDGDSNLYAFSCNIGNTNWSFVNGGTTALVPIYHDPIGTLRDPSHIHYQGKYYLVYNTSSPEFGVAVSDDDVHWTYAGRASVGPGAYWSPKFFVDGTNGLWCNIRYSDVPGGTYPYQQYCFRFDTSNPTNTVDRDGRFVCTNIWHDADTDYPTAAIVWNDGLFYLFTQGGDSFCSPGLESNCWTQIGWNLFESPLDGPCLAKYQGTWYITDSQNGSSRWFYSTDLINWMSADDATGWSGFGLEEGTAIVENSTVTSATLAWQPADTNLATVIVAANDLALPRDQWQTVFTGVTNACILRTDEPRRYFSGFNVSPFVSGQVK